LSENNIFTLKQIKEAKRLLRALQITEGRDDVMTLDEMLERVVEMDRQSEAEAGRSDAGALTPAS